MTTYGTIPTSQSPNTASSNTHNLEFITRTKHKIQSTLATRRPWNLLFSLSSLSFPTSINDTFLTIKTNLSYFRMNYAIIALIILFLSLLWHPLSLIVFTLFMSAWLFFYFLRDAPIVVFGYVVGDKAVLLLLTVLTVVFLLLTDVTVNIVVALAVALAVIVVHAAVRSTDDLPVSDAGFEDESGARVVFSRNTGGLGERLPLKDTASSSFSASN